MPSPRLLALVAAASILATAPASAWQRHHHHRASRPAPPDSGEAYVGSYAGGGWQAEAIERATREMQDAPGVTNELAPDAKATATGGPSGGVPGFSGGR